ncbi:MAG: PAS domain S-box protein [Desulfobacterales bacterium]
MNPKPTYEELEDRINELEKTVASFKRFENILNKSDGEYRQLVENLNDVIYFLDPEGRILYISPVVEEITQYTVGDLTGKNVFEMVHPDDLPGLLKSFERTLNGRHEPYEYRIFDKDGSMRHVRSYSRLIYDGEKLIGMTGVISDVLYRKYIEQVIKESQERYKAIFERSLDCIYVHDFEGNFIDANEQTLKLIGCGKDELKTLNFHSLIDPAQVRIARKGMEFLRKNGYYEDLQEYNITCRNGGFKYIEARASLIEKDGQPYAIQGVARDITEKKMLMKDLRLKDLAINSSINGIALTDLDGRLTFVNPSFLTLWRYGNSEEVVNRNAIDFWQNPEQAGEVLQAIKNNGSWMGDLIAKRKDGTQFDAHLSANLVFNECNEPVSIITSFLDITVQRELEANLRQNQKMEAIGTLVCGISHDFNNILTLIIGNAEMAIEMIARNRQPEDYIKRILDAGFRARDIVGQLVTISRQRENDKIPLKINFLINETLKLIRSTIPSNIKIIKNIRYESSSILGDPSQINQLVINLCINAFHAMEETGGTLDIELKDIHLNEIDAEKLQLSGAGKYVRLAVKDTGTGIDPKHEGKIFEPYFTTKEFGKGSGLGLFTVYGTVKNHNAAIDVSSSSETGTTIAVFFPVFETELKSMKPSPLVHTAKHHLSVLFVDDDKLIMELAELMLDNLGYESLCVTNPLEALDLFKSDPDRFDVIITDLSMPEMGGDALARCILDIRPTIPIILCTGYNELDDEKTDGSGIKAVLHKPFKKDHIREAIQAVLTVDR